MKSEERYREWLAGVRHVVYTLRTTTQAALAGRVNVARERLNGVLRGRLDAGAGGGRYGCGTVVDAEKRAALSVYQDCPGECGEAGGRGAAYPSALAATRLWIARDRGWGRPAGAAAGDAPLQPGRDRDV